MSLFKANTYNVDEQNYEQKEISVSARATNVPNTAYECWIEVAKKQVGIIVVYKVYSRF